MSKNVIQATWIQSDNLERFLMDYTKNGSCLNVCCGYSMVGTTRIDINSESWRTDEGDLFKLPYPNSSFDYVYCDPPFKFYTYGDNRIRWQLKLFDICKKALITRRPKVNISMKSKSHVYYICEDAKLSLSLIRVDFK